MYTAKDFSELLGLGVLSDQSLQSHFGLYQGYVKNTNKLLDELATLRKAGQMDSPAGSEIQRRLGWEFNGMRLHEVYFSSLTKTPGSLLIDAPLANQMIKDFGSVADWEKSFKQLVLTRGVGWAALYWDPQGGRLLDIWVNEHDTGHLANCALLLVIDVFEHAYLPDFGTNRAAYLEAIWSHLDWLAIAARWPIQ